MRLPDLNSKGFGDTIDTQDDDIPFNSKKKNSRMPENMTMEELMKSTAAQDLFYQRGCKPILDFLKNSYRPNQN